MAIKTYNVLHFLSYLVSIIGTNGFKRRLRGGGHAADILKLPNGTNSTKDRNAQAWVIASPSKCVKKLQKRYKLKVKGIFHTLKKARPDMQT